MRRHGFEGTRLSQKKKHQPPRFPGKHDGWNGQELDVLCPTRPKECEVKATDHARRGVPLPRERMLETIERSESAHAE